MLKKVRTVSLFLSVSLLLAHTFVPHHHLSDPGGKLVYHSCAEVRSTSLVDLIASFFEQDLGNDHLSKFVAKKFEKGKLPCFTIHSDLSQLSLLPVLERLSYRPLPVVWYQDPTVRHASSRGPPLV